MEQEQPKTITPPQKASWAKIHRELILRIGLFMLGAVIGAGFYWLASNNFFLGRHLAVSDDTPTVQNQYSPSKQVSAYLVWWDQDSGFASLQANKDKISTVHPVWYRIQADGTVEKFTGAENAQIIQFAKDNNIKIIPTFTNDCDPAASEAVLQNSSLMTAHINTIAQLVADNGYDGADINYECLAGQPLRGAFSSFLTSLSQALHGDGKLLTTSVHQKTNDAGSWDGPAAQDWAVINEVCDQIKIMTYDYHWATSEAGDIAPLAWMRDTLVYAQTILNPQKTYLGIHFYGYDWVGMAAVDLTYQAVADMISGLNPTINVSGEDEKYFTYPSESQTHTVYFADKDVVLPRIELANEYDIAGIGVWRLGGEDPANWQAIADEFGI